MYWVKYFSMTKLVLELKNERQIAVLKAILKFLNIPIVEEKKEEEGEAPDIHSFYEQFQIDLSGFKFNRQEANER